MVFRTLSNMCRYFDFQQQFINKQVTGPHRAWKRRKILRLSSHFLNRKNYCYSIAIRSVFKALNRARENRRLRGHNFNRLWRHRSDAACQELGTSFQSFEHELRAADVHVSPKSLQQLAVREPRSFRGLVQLTKGLSVDPGLNSLEGPPAGAITRAMMAPGPRPR